MRTRNERRKLTFKRIKRNYKLNSYFGKKGNGLTEKEQAQPHRLYKGKDYNNRAGRYYRSGHLPPSRHDMRNELNSKEAKALLENIGFDVEVDEND